MNETPKVSFMDNPKDGTAQPATDELSQSEQTPKLRIYKTPNGESFQITEEEFAQVVEIFDYLKRIRGSRDTQPDTVEPDLSGLKSDNPVNWKVG